MESQSSLESEKDTLEAVLRNPLIVDKICSSTTAAELLKLRLVNSFFHHQATRRLRKINHKPVFLGNKSSIVENFLTLMKTRYDPEEINSFPFSSYALDPRQSANTIEHFAAEVGQHVRRLHVTFTGLFSLNDKQISDHQLPQKLVSILSRVPKLTEITLMSHHPIQMANSDLPHLPQSFPELRVLDLVHDCRSETATSNSTPLLALMISRATRLDEVRTIRIYDSPEDNDGLAALRALTRHHKTQLPVLGRGLISIRPHSLPVIQELNTMKPNFKNLNTMMNIDFRNFSETVRFQNLIYNLSDFLAAQRLCLDRLCFGINIDELQGILSLTVPIPSLVALTEFYCLIMVHNQLNDAPSTTLTIPLASNHFPALRFFRLDFYSDKPNSNVRFEFELSPQPSVYEFVLSTPYLFESNPWHSIFPNLSSMSIHFHNSYWICDDEDNLRYILKYFPRLTCLELTFPNYYLTTRDPLPDHWSTLTGGAIRPASTDALLHEDLGQVVEELEYPINGIYQTASLSNLRALQTLKCNMAPRNYLDAIVYMTRTGRLGPLNKLIVTGLEEYLKMEIEERTGYRDVLAQVHTDVCLTDGWESPVVTEGEYKFCNDLIGIYN